MFRANLKHALLLLALLIVAESAFSTEAPMAPANAPTAPGLRGITH